MRTETRLRFALRNLRHLYEQMLAGQVTDQIRAAKGLLGPAIELLESEDHTSSWQTLNQEDQG